MQVWNGFTKGVVGVQIIGIIIVGLVAFFVFFKKMQDPQLGVVGDVLSAQMIFIFSLIATLQIFSSLTILKWMDKKLDDLGFALKAHEEVLKSLKKQ